MPLFHHQNSSPSNKPLTPTPYKSHTNSPKAPHKLHQNYNYFDKPSAQKQATSLVKNGFHSSFVSRLVLSNLALHFWSSGQSTSRTCQRRPSEFFSISIRFLPPNNTKPQHQTPMWWNQLLAIAFGSSSGSQ